MAKKQQQDSPVLLPRYVVSEAQWAAVPRTVPDSLLRWGGSLPLLVVLFVGFRFSGIGFAMDPDLEFIAIGALIFTVPLAVFAGRVAPWISLLGTVFLMAYGQNESTMFFVLLWVLFYWLLALGLLEGFSAARFSRVIRQWRRAAAGQVEVDGALLGSTRMQRRASASLRAVSLSIVVLVVAKVVISFFTDAGRDVRALAGTAHFDDLEPLVVPLAGFGFWLLIVVFRLIQEKIAGDVVLEVPLDPTIGPLVYQRAVQAVDYHDAQRDGCICGGKKRNRPEGLPPVLDVDDRCPVHGIEAVNSLGHREFLAVADHPWVWGANAAKLPLPPHTKLSIVGLHGWGSRPAVLGTPARLKDSEAATHTGYRPWRAVEVFNRAKRKIRWRDLSDTSMAVPAVEESEVDVLDRIGLDPAGLPGYAVRVKGGRPRFESGPMPQANRYAPKAAAMRASKQ